MSMRETYQDAVGIMIAGPASILIDLREGNGSNAYDSYIRKIDDYTVEGYRYVRGWSPSRKVYFVLKSDKKIEQFTAYDDNTPLSCWR